MDKISIDEFKKGEIRIGEILTAEKVEGADRLLRLTVSFGEETRQIVSGIASYYPDPAALVGVTCAFATNLEPRMIRGLESDGMILAASTEEGTFSLLEAKGVPPGTRIK
jgi:methionine--tRNA ligase beta chain